MYGFQCVTDLVIPTSTAIEYKSVGISFADHNGYAFYGAQNVILGTNGKLYLYPASNLQYTITNGFNITFMQPLLTVKDLNLAMD